MKKWEYRVKILPLTALIRQKGKKDYVSEQPKEDALNALGRDGWELVSVSSPCVGGDRYAIAYLKKEVAEEVER